MRIADLRVDAPIEPNYGLGGLALRTHVRELTGLLDELWSRVTETDDGYVFELASPTSAVYRFGAVEAGLDVSSGMLYRLSALPGYDGLRLGSISVHAPEALLPDADAHGW